MRFYLRAFYQVLLTLGLSPALLLPFNQVVWASENATALASPYIHRLQDNDKRLPATLTAWKEVDLVYERLFPYDRARQLHPPASCVVLPAISNSSDKQGTGIKTTSAVLMLRCQERIDLLRPARWVNNRLQQQNQQGYLVVSMPEMDINDIRVHIVVIKPSLFNPAVLAMKHSLSKPVIGIFIHHTTNVKQYTFKDTLTGKLDSIKATPNHPFYVVNQQRYIPVSHLSPHDQLINVLGHPVILVCPTGKTSHCGQPYHPGQVITVYNLEVYGQHRYFVGEPGVLVHNGYRCKFCGNTFRRQSDLTRHQLMIHSYSEDRLSIPRWGRSQTPEKHSGFMHAETARPIECKVCNEVLPNDQFADMHYQSERHKQNFDDFIKKLRRFRLEAELNAQDEASSLPSDSASVETEQARARSRSPIESLTSYFQSLRTIDIPHIPPLSSADDKLPELLPEDDGNGMDL